MGEEISSAINLAVDLLIAALIISTWSALMYLTGALGRTGQNEIDSIKVVQEYRQMNQYDNTEVYPQDIINYIFETRGFPEVWVDTDATPAVTFTWKWTKTGAPCAYTASELATLLPASGTYLSTIVKNANGEVARIEFRR